jgi:ribosomal protein L24E
MWQRTSGDSGSESYGCAEEKEKGEGELEVESHGDGVFFCVIRVHEFL